MSVDLLDLLAAETEPLHVHATLPSMALACGRDLSATMRAGWAAGVHATTTGPYSEVTCPDCLALDLHAIARRQMGRQAKGTQ